MRVDVKVNTTGLDQIAREMPKAAKAGLKKTAEQAKTKASEIIRDMYNISKSNLEKPAPGKTKGDVFRILPKYDVIGWIIRISGNKIPLYRFGNRWTRKMSGARVSVEGGRSTTYPHVFRQTVGKGGHIGLFIRKSILKKTMVGTKQIGKYERKGGQKLTPERQIVEVTGPAPGQMIRKRNHLERLRTFIVEKAEQLVLHEFQWRKGK